MTKKIKNYGNIREYSDHNVICMQKWGAQPDVDDILIKYVYKHDKHDVGSKKYFFSWKV